MNIGTNELTKIEKSACHWELRAPCAWPGEQAPWPVQVLRKDREDKQTSGASEQRPVFAVVIKSKQVPSRTV